jgi:uncharacterized membrane protein
MQLFRVSFLLLIAFAAYRAHSLNRSGAIAAAITGTVIFGIGGWSWAVLLLTFFITSSVLSRLFKSQKAGLNEKYSKGHERDAGQVFGNGGIAALRRCRLYRKRPGVDRVRCGAAWRGYLGDGAGGAEPIRAGLLTDLKQVERDIGGIRWGIGAAFLGSALIATLAVLFPPYEASSLSEWLLITIAGVAGSLFDSLLGATVQAIYYCPSCQKETERSPLHTCGTQTRQVRGWTWLDNDWVNFACGLMGAIVALLGLL